MATLAYDRLAKEMRVQDPDTFVEVVEVYSQTRDYEAELINMTLPQIVAGAGKEPLGQVLGASVFVGITMTLLDNWKIGWEDQAGPALATFEIRGGNTLGQVEDIREPSPTFQNPIAATANATITRTNSSSATLIQPDATFDVIDATRLLEIWQLLGLDISNPLTVTKTSQAAGAISQTIGGDGENTSTVTRNP